MRRFYLQRNEDESGVSGVGVVAEGVEFQNGRVAMQWLKPSMTGSSTSIFDNINCVVLIHGHNGKTKIIWLDPDGTVD